MTYMDWTEPVRLLREGRLPATDKQNALAQFVGLDLAHALPRGVVAAMLEDALRPHVWGASTEPLPATEKQLDFLGQIAHGELWPQAPLSRRSASAWIEDFLAERTSDRLEEVRLVRGDRVTKKHSYLNQVTGELHMWVEELEVSSIGASGLVYFRGGNGKCAWPTSLDRATSE